MRISNELFKILKQINQLFELSKLRTWDYNILMTATYFNPIIVKFDNFDLITSDRCSEYYGINSVYPPFLHNEGHITDIEIKQSLEYLESVNDTILGGMFCIPDNIYESLTKSEYAYYEYDPEYIYNVNEQLLLNGSKFKGIRRAINKFIKNSYEIEPLNRKHIEECMILSEKKQLSEQELYISLDIYEDIKKIDMSLFGFVVRQHDKIVGVSINSMHENTAYNLQRRVDHNVDGITEFMNQYMLKHFKEINPNLSIFNDGDDAGEDGLKAYKVKMKPITMKRIFEIYKKENPLEACIKYYA